MGLCRAVVTAGGARRLLALPWHRRQRGACRVTSCSAMAGPLRDRRAQQLGVTECADCGVVFYLTLSFLMTYTRSSSDSEMTYA